MSDQQAQYWQRRMPRTYIPVPVEIDVVEPVEVVEIVEMPPCTMTRGEMAIMLTARHFNVAQHDIMGRSRNKAICAARHVAMAVWVDVVRGGYGLGYSKAARRWGVDHTSIIYARNKVSNTPELQAVAQMLIDEINGS